MILEFNEKRATQATAILLRLAVNCKFHITKILKILYLADRQHLIEEGFPFIGANFQILSDGPESIDISNCIYTMVSDTFWNKHIVLKESNLTLILNPNDGELNYYQTDILKNLYIKYKDYSEFDIINFTRNLPECDGIYKLITPLSINNIWKAAKVPPNTIKRYLNLMKEFGIKMNEEEIESLIVTKIEYLSCFRNDYELALKSADTKSELFSVRSEFLGKNSKLNLILKQIKTFPSDERLAIGKVINELTTWANERYQYALQGFLDKDFETDDVKEIPIGSIVRMSKELKEQLFDSGSTEHVLEFSKCLGIVIGKVNYQTQQGPELDVKWMPSGLKYGYHPNLLVIINGRGEDTEEDIWYRLKYSRVSAIKWMKNGDHPDDGNPEKEGKIVRYFRSPSLNDDFICPQCAHKMLYHGWIDDVSLSSLEDTVCPGDYIILSNGKYSRMSNHEFNEKYDLEM